MLEKLYAEQLSLPAGRYYSFDEERCYPSVTNILGATGNKFALQAWRKRVGAEEASRIGREAAARGTAVHSVIESLLLEGEIPEYDESIEPWVGSVLPVLSHVKDPLLIEGPLWHSKGYAGTVDCVAHIDGVPTCIDWKTSEKHKLIKYTEDYFLQATAYTAAVNERYGTEIRQAAIIVALPNMEAQIFLLKRDAMLKCWDRFNQRLQQFREMS